MPRRLRYVCPNCTRKLRQESNAYHCGSCAQRWPERDGIPSFATGTFYWNQISEEEMSRLLATAQAEGYQVALHKHLLPNTDEYVYRYALDESRGDFRFLLPLGGRTRILDLGCGWGSVTCAVARTAGQVVGADTNVQTLRFVRLRAQQEGLHNLTPVHMDPLDYAGLPFPSGYFDAVLMNGVLEWVGSAARCGSPRRLQLRALRETRRVLKPEGCLYVGIENRCAYGYFFGAPDEHSGVWLTNLMPRPLADMYMRLKHGRGYRTYTYSLSGYRRLFRAAGYGQIECFIPMRSYREPEFLIPAHDSRALAYFLNVHFSRRNLRNQIFYGASRLLAAVRAFPWFVPGYAFVARPV